MVDPPESENHRLFLKEVDKFCKLYHNITEILVNKKIWRGNTTNCNAVLEKILRRFREDFAIGQTPTDEQYEMMTAEMNNIDDLLGSLLQQPQLISDSCLSYIESRSCDADAACYAPSNGRPTFCLSNQQRGVIDYLQSVLMGGKEIVHKMTVDREERKRHLAAAQERDEKSRMTDRKKD